MDTRPGSSLPYALQSLLLWSFAPILWSFMALYLQQKGLNPSRIGIVMAMNPLTAVFFQPLFGPMADRAISKNRFFMVFAALSVLMLFLFPLGDSFPWLVLAAVLLSIAQTPLIPVSESIALESLEHIDRSYGPVRMTGTLGFSLFSLLVGYFMARRGENLFYIAALIGGANILLTGLLPTVKGHQERENRVSAGEIFRDRKLTLFILLSAAAQLAVSLYMTYLPLYYFSIGGVGSRLGTIYFLMGTGEILVLLFADRIIARLGIQRALGLSVAVMGLRFLVLTVIDSPFWMVPLSLLNGFTFIIFGFGLAVFMNRSVRRGLKTTGQSVLALASAAGRVIGALAGGFLISALGIKPAMAGVGVFCFAVLGAYALVLRRISNGSPLPRPDLHG